MWFNDDCFYLFYDIKEFIFLWDVVWKCLGICLVMFSVVRRMGEVGCLYLLMFFYWSMKNSGK